MKTKKPMLKVIVTNDLIELNRRAVKAKRNRSFTDDIYDLLDPDGIHVVGYTMVHNDEEMRVQILMKFKGEEYPVRGWLDMSFEDFAKLPEVEAS